MYDLDYISADRLTQPYRPHQPLQLPTSSSPLTNHVLPPRVAALPGTYRGSVHLPRSVRAQVPMQDQRRQVPGCLPSS